MADILAIDPGPERSAWLRLAGGVVCGFGIVVNDDLLGSLRSTARTTLPRDPMLVLEMIASYGMPVGADVFETCVWIGRFTQAWLNEGCRSPQRLTRMQVKMHVCHSARATDANVRQALIDRFGPGKETAVGRKATPGPLYGVSKDVWAALGVAVTANDAQAQRAG